MEFSLSDRSPKRFAFRMPRLTRARLFGAAACILGGAIAVNATLFQSERHPAPMFRTLAKPKPVELPTPPLRGEARGNAEPVKADTKQALAAPMAEPLLRDLQTELAARGYYKGEPDGKAGPATTKAIRDFQTDRRMSADGQPSEALLADVRSSRETMKDELFDLVKRAHAPERGDKPAPRKAEPAKPAKSGEAESRAPQKVAAKPKPKAEAKAETAKPAKAVAQKDAAEKNVAKKDVSTQAKAKTAPRHEDGKAETKAKAVVRAEPAPKPAARPARLEADAPIRPPANVAEAGLRR